MIERTYPWLMLLSSSNREHQPYPLSYFSVVVGLRCVLHHILLLVAYTFRENRGFFFITSVQFMMSVKSRIHFGLQIVFAYWYITPSHYHHCANLSEGIENSCQIFLSSVWVRLSTFFFTYPLYNIWGCVFAVYLFPLWWLREYALVWMYELLSIV